MPTPNAGQIADQFDQLADRIAATEGSAAPAALRMVATALRGDEAKVHSWLTQFLHQVETGELLAAAALKLELEAARGNADAQRAAEHVQVAGAIYYGEGR